MHGPSPMRCSISSRRTAFGLLPARDFPHLRELAPVLADYDGEAELDEGISILLSGLAERLTGGAGSDVVR